MYAINTIEKRYTEIYSILIIMGWTVNENVAFLILTLHFNVCLLVIEKNHDRSMRLKSPHKYAPQDPRIYSIGRC